MQHTPGRAPALAHWPTTSSIANRGGSARLAILLEEVNATMAQLKRYWAKIRESGDPKESPAVDALAEILVQVVSRGRAQETQVLNLSHEEAREWAMSGIHAKTNRPAQKRSTAP
ncbi:hypothetical protein ACWD0J_41205 [Streptomyces sp. NPDC003011]